MALLSFEKILEIIKKICEIMLVLIEKILPSVQE